MMEKAHPQDIVLIKEIIQGTPVLAVFKPDGQPKPLILLSHGFNENKERWTHHLQVLGTSGYYAVALDNHNHRERMGADFATAVFCDGALKLHEVRRLIKETADDIPRLIDHFAASLEVNSSQIGLAGVSMGAFVTFRALVIESRISVAVPIIGSPYWDDIPKDVRVASDLESRRALARISRAYSPAFFPERFYPRPLLIQIGGRDGHYQPGRVRQFYERLQKGHYQENPQRLQLVIHPEVGHEFTSAMWASALEWFQQYLPVSTRL